MINFVLYEDNLEVLNQQENIIQKLMMKSDELYKLYKFSKYTKQLSKYIKEKHEKNIYILDVEVPIKSGIDISREIRSDDWNSIIIIVTNHSELLLQVFKDRLMLFDFISKFDQCDKKLLETIEAAIEVYNNDNSLKFKVGRVIHNVKQKDILYILKEKDSHKLIIKTNSEEYITYGSLQIMEKKLSYTFYKLQRNIIINKNKVKKIDKNKREIEFNNSIKVDGISLKGLKELNKNVVG